MSATNHTQRPTHRRELARFSLVAMALVALSFLSSASGSSAADPLAVKTVPNLKLDGKLTVDDISADLDLNWENWEVVKVVPKKDAKNLLALEQHPRPNKELSEGEFMHIYVDGSGGDVDLIEDPKVLQPIILIQGFLTIFLAFALWRCRKK